MIDVQPKHVHRRWEICPREARESRWATPYATINAAGDIVISRLTHETLGSPDGYVLLYDREREIIGLKPARANEKNAYPARQRGRHGGRRVRAYRLCREFGIHVFETVRFHHCMLDREGILLLDLRDTRPAGKKKRGRH